MPKTVTPRAKLRPFYFEADGKMYKVGVPEDYDEEKAFRAGMHLLKNGELRPVPKVDIFADYSPIKVEPRYRPETFGDAYSSTYSDDEERGPINKREIELGERGVLTGQYGKVFSNEDMATFNTAGTQDELAYAVGAKVKEKFGADNFSPIDLVRYEGGDLYYFDINTPTNTGGTNRWVRFENPTALNPWEMGKAGASTIGGVLGGLPGVLAGNLPAARLGTSLGAGVPAGIIEYARQQAGIKRGVNDPDYTYPVWEGVKEGGMVAGLSFAMDAALSKFLRPGRINAYFFDRTYYKEFQEGLRAGQKNVDDIRDLAARLRVDIEYNPSLAKLSGVKELLDLEATLANRQVTKGSEAITQTIKKRDREADRALGSILRRLTEPTGAPLPSSEIGIEVKAAAREGVPRIDALRRGRARLEQEMGKFRREVEQKAPSELQTKQAISGSTDKFDLRRGLAEAKELDEVVEADLWKKATDSMGTTFVPKDESGLILEAVDTVKIPMTGKWFQLHQLARRYAEAINTMFPSGTQQQFGDYMERIFLAAKNNEDIGVSTFVNGIKQLRQIARENFARAKNSPYKVDEEFLKRLEETLVSIRDQHLSRGPHKDILHNLRVAEEYSNEMSTKWFRSKLVSLIDSPKHAREFMDSIFTPGDPSTASRVVAALKGDPDALKTLQLHAQARYADAVFNENNIVDPTRYKQFMKDHGRTMEEIVDESTLGLFRKFGGMGEALAKTIRNQEVAEKAFLNQWQGKVSRMKSEDIVDKVFFSGSRLSNDETRQMVAWLGKNQPALLERVKAGVQEQLRERLYKKSGDLAEFTMTSLGSILKQQEKLAHLFGPRYVQDLRTIYNGLVIGSRKGTAFNIPMNTPALASFRVIFGPLSRIQRGISAARQYSIVGYEKTLFKILTDPKKLRLAIKYGSSPVNSDFMGPILFQLGIQFEDDEQDAAARPGKEAYR